MTKDEALKQALEVIEAIHTVGDVECVVTPDGTIYLRPTIADIKEALAHDDEDAIIIQYHEATIKILEKCIEELTAQPKQEPYGYFKAEPFGWVECAETDDDAKALYEAPPQRPWVGLTEEERSSFWTPDYMTQKGWDRLFDSIEDKLKQKNT